MKLNAITDGDGSGQKRVLLRDEAYSTIKEFLLTEESEEFLSERTLASRLNLGLAPVRSAVERLRAEGLLTAMMNSGLRLPEITAREILDFYEMRIVIETHVVASLTGKLSPDQFEQLNEILNEQESCAETRNTIRYHQLDLDFHTTLAELHGNSEMVRTLQQMRDKMYRLSRRLHRLHPERLSLNAQQHRAIVDAIWEGEVEKSRNSMQAHLAWGRAFTLDPDGRMGEDWQQMTARG
ncbi:GntR family transcriptional regulator protein (plasmid) [Rhizobium phaseoli]|uniref:GntR family transcriptional regulator n=1 Tax=Rhizobium phaseoli TaxID=396 RepID=UPI0007E94650|nr:GntR family transcriptional regulator [Rhizobium phaseoli]ANL51024.1 GntR family transcriptional regulator protein [Rhizobium phaseoli]